MRRGLLLGLLMAGIAPLATVQAAEGLHSGWPGYHMQNPFIFTEDGVTFAVYPDGEFDFYLDSQIQVGFQAGNVSVTFNSGFNYNPFVQYDHYGAVIQVEHIPIFYDPWGRVEQIGNVNIFYRHGWVNQIGGLTVYYRNGVFSHTVGFVNVYNRRYIFRPWHRHFIRPVPRYCNVWQSPYRMYYEPVRYSYYRPYANNRRVSYYRVGTEGRYQSIRDREVVYRNDSRVSAVRSSRSERYEGTGRSNYSADQRVDTERIVRADANTRSGQSPTKYSRESTSSTRSSQSPTKSSRESASNTRSNQSSARSNQGVSTGVRERNSQSPKSTTTGSSSNRSSRPSETRSGASTSRSNTSGSTSSRQTAMYSSSQRQSVTQSPSPTRSASKATTGKERSVRTEKATSTRNATTRSTSSRSNSSRSGSSGRSQ